MKRKYPHATTSLSKMIFLSLFLLLYGCTSSVIASTPTEASVFRTDTDTPASRSTSKGLSTAIPTNLAIPTASIIPLPITPAPGASPSMIVITLVVGDPLYGKRALYSVYPDGTGLTRLVENLETVGSPLWSPDGTKLAFTNFEGIDQAPLYIMNMTNGEVRRYDVSVLRYSWSPDSEMIVYTEYFSFPPPYLGWIDVLSVDDMEIGTLFSTESWEVVDVLWSPTDVNQILALLRGESESALYMFDLEGNRRELPTYYMPDTFMRMAWDPISQLIVYYPRCEGCTRLRVINADGTQDRALTLAGEEASSPHWSPDGRFLAYTTSRLFPDSLRINILELESGEIAWVSSGGICSYSYWSPDSEYLAFLTHPDESSASGCALNILSLETLEVSQIISEGVEGVPAWRP